jgi:D-alanyl-D-alanine carboxypeptidase-like protein
VSADISALIPPLQPFAQALVDLAGRAGVQPRITSTLRSRTQQERLYRAFLRGESHYPVAPPGTSAHEFGYAFDMVASTTEDLRDLGQVWQSWGGLWSPADEVHFEYPGFSHASVPVDTPVDPSLSCDLSDWRNWIFWRPECACRIVDLLKGSWIASLAQMGFPDSEILALFSSPCMTILDKIAKLGL